MELKKRRRELDCIDFKIVSLLEKRKKKILQMGKIKNLHRIQIVQKEREKELVKNLINRVDIEPNVIKKIYNILFRYSYQLQRRKR